MAVRRRRRADEEVAAKLRRRRRRVTWWQSGQDGVRYPANPADEKHHDGGGGRHGVVAPASLLRRSATPEQETGSQVWLRRLGHGLRYGAMATCAVWRDVAPAAASSCRRGAA